MRLDSHVCYSTAHPPEHLGAVLARSRFDGALLVVDEGVTLPPLSHIVGLIVRGPLRNGSGTNPNVRAVSLRMADAGVSAAEALERAELALDVEMRAGDFPQLLQLADAVPHLRIAIDHLARPDFARGLTVEWARGMEQAARRPNVFCKLSGLLTEVQTLPWSAAPIQPFVQHVLQLFTPDRLMFGSEWPLRLPDITWKESLAAFTQSIGAHSLEVREQLLGETARVFYAIPS